MLINYPELQFENVEKRLTIESVVHISQSITRTLVSQIAELVLMQFINITTLLALLCFFLLKSCTTQRKI